MKKIILTSIFLSVIALNLSAQKTLLHLPDTRDVIPFAVKEDGGGNLFVAGRFTDKRFQTTNEEDTIRGFIMKLSTAGEVLSKNFVNTETTGDFEDIILLDNGDAIVVGGLSGINGSAAGLNGMTVTRFNNDLELLWTKKYFDNGYIKKIVKVNDEFWCFGSAFLQPAYTMLKINENGDSLDFRLELMSENQLPTQKVYEAVYHNNKCFVSIRGLPDMSPFSILAFENFNAIPDSIPVALWSLPSDEPYNAPSLTNGMLVNGNDVFLNAGYYNVPVANDSDKADKVFLSKSDITTKEKSLVAVQNEEELDDTFNYYPGGITANENNFFCAVNYNRGRPSMLHLFDNSFKVSKIIVKMLDFSGNVIKQEMHDEEGAHDVCFSLIHTQSGKIIAVGTRYVAAGENDTKDFVLVEFFNDLSITNDVLEHNDLKVYPNPSEGIFNFEYPKENIPYTVHNAIGKQVIKGKTTLKNKIDLSEFQNGFYFIKIEDKSLKLIKTQN